MPQVLVVFFQESRNSSATVDWLREVRRSQPKVYAKLVARIEQLARHGHELRRPVADYLRDGIYELRQRHGSVNYRLLYFFHGQRIAVLAGGLVKEDVVPMGAIHQAIDRKARFCADTLAHTYSSTL